MKKEMRAAWETHLELGCGSLERETQSQKEVKEISFRLAKNVYNNSHKDHDETKYTHLAKIFGTPRLMK